MRNSLLTILVLTIATFFSCAQKKVTTTQTQDVAVEQAKVPVVTPVVTYVRMERTPCFGRCEHYALELSQDGMARYSGYRFTNFPGVYEIGIGDKQAKEMLAKLATYRPDTCQNDYEVLISDISGVNYKIEFSDQSVKEIRNAHFGPAFLAEYANSLDQLLQVDDSWRIIADSASDR